ncbi:MAG: amidase [Gemmatimonadota bacterium]|nr:amidase [Gemmatimonadota bacterium]
MSSAFDPSSVSRRGFLASAAALAAAQALPLNDASALPASPAHLSPGTADIVEQGIAELSAAMQRGDATARQVTQQYLDRIAAMDHVGPALHYVIEANPDALAIADSLDAERRSGRIRGPIHGIPVLVKDNIDSADRMSTTAGSRALEGHTPTRDAHVVAQLRAAGAIVLGKTNLSEWANFRSTHASSGWSGRGGQARNPYALDRTPSGSSSGSAGATASSYCAVAIGTETDGSITSPAAACSLVGLKPTVGLVSRSGIIPIAHTQDTAGPMARSVTDAAILLSVLIGRDTRDAATSRAPTTRPLSYMQALDMGGMKGARIGVARAKFTGYSVAADAHFETALLAMKEAGAVIVDPADIATAGKFDDAEYEVLLYEFKTDLEAYLATLPAGARARTLDDLVAFNRAHASEEMPYFGQEIFEQAAKKGPLSSPAYRKALATCGRLARVQGLDATFLKHRLDAIVAPTQGPPALIDLVNGDPSSSSSTSPCAVAGYPAITVPMGYASGLPLGITFMGKAWSEATLLRLAYAYEQVTKVRVPPRFLPSAQL